MDTPSNKEVSLSNKRLWIRLQRPSSGTGKDEVRVNLASLACQKGKIDLVEEADHSPRYTCEVCEKTFPSLKSLHGHTRVHPKDEKKEVVIHDSQPTLSSSKDEDEEVKARKRKNYEDPRSKDAVRHSDTIMFVDTQEEERNGARNLYFLKYGKDWDTTYEHVSTSIKRSKSKDNVASSSNSQLVMGYDIGIGIYYSNKQRELIKEMQAAQIPTENESWKEKEKCMTIIPYVGNSSTQIPIETVRSLEIVTYAGKISTQSPTENQRFDVNEGKKIMTEISSNAEGVVLHVCRICHMSFIKPQALGGHMTLHRTNEQKIQGDEIVNKKNGHKEEHECEKCGRKFPTGQKLGGHKRAHYDKEKLKKRKCTDMISECSPVNSKEDGQVVVKNVGVPGTEEVHGGVEKVKGLGDELSMVNSKEEGQVVAGYVGDHGTEEANGGVKHGFDLNLEPMEQHGEN